MRVGASTVRTLVPCAAALLLAATLAHATPAGIGDVFSYGRDPGAAPISGFTVVAKRRLPVGVYAFTTTGLIRNRDMNQPAYVSCFASSLVPVIQNTSVSEFLVPRALQAGVPGAGTWSISGTVEIPPDTPGGSAMVSVVCGNFGPASDDALASWFPNIIAIGVEDDRHKNGS